MDCLKNGFKQIFERFQKRRNKAVNCIPDTWNRIINSGADSWNNHPYCIENVGKKVVNTGQNFCEEVIYRSENRDCCGIDRSRYRCKERGDCIPDVCEKVSNSLKSGTDAVPYSNKEVLNWCPHFIPWCSEPTEKYICYTSQRVHYIAELVDYKIPDTCKNALDTSPALFPVSRKQTDKYIKHAQNGIRHKGENIRNMLKYALKHRSKHTA